MDRNIPLQSSARVGGATFQPVCPKSLALWQEFARQYLCRTKPTKADLLRRLQHRIDFENKKRLSRGANPLVAPSRKRFEKIINAFDMFEVVAAREGIAVAQRLDRKHQPEAKQVVASTDAQRLASTPIEQTRPLLKASVSDLRPQDPSVGVPATARFRAAVDRLRSIHLSALASIFNGKRH